MVNCVICPVREECKAIKERITNRYLVNMLPDINEALNFCPLVVIITDNFEAASEELSNL